MTVIDMSGYALSVQLRAHLASYEMLRHRTVGEDAPITELMEMAAAEAFAFTKDERFGGWSPYGLLATHGATWEGSSLPARYSKGLPKNCYQNCWEKARRSTTLLYCEGQAMSADLGLPMAHAWLFDTATGAIIEPTWDTQRSKHAYLGFVFPTELVREARKRSGRHSVAVIEGDWARQGWFLREAADDVITFTHTITQT